jgi:gamma-glutamyltranspeptidase / glutathione hydrolase
VSYPFDNLESFTGTLGPRDPIPGRSLVCTRFGIVAASQPLAASAGVQILECGGNAIDAAIAANAATGLMEPTGNGIGGDLFALIHDAASGRLFGLNASGWAPAGNTVEHLRARGIDSLPFRGIHTVTVPGAVAGWDAMHRRFGRLSFADILQPAIWYAEHGFPVSEITSGLWARSIEMLSAHPNSRDTFLIDGRAPRPGELFRNTDLARTLTRIAQRRHAGFYTGPVAESIVAISHELGGTMALADLAEFEAEWVDPIQTSYRGWTVSQIPPNTQGIATLMMLNIMEQFPLGEWGFHSPGALHVMIEAKKLAYADMLEYTADMRMARVPVDAMLDKAHAIRRSELIDHERAMCAVEASSLGMERLNTSETIYLTVADVDGNIVSLIQSNYGGFGSGIVPAGTGFMLHNRGALFALEPGKANTLAPRKRPLHTIIPGFMEKDGMRIGFGIMGLWNQAQAHAQFVSNIADHGLTIQQALEAGRFTKGTFQGCDVQIEAHVPESVCAELSRRGHDIQVVAPRTSTFGYGQAVMRTSEGVNFGASDPRHDGAAIPQPAPVFDRSPTP